MACIQPNQEATLQTDSSILTSFLDDSQLECCDDERLKIVIQSLEAAINPFSSMDERLKNGEVFDEEKVYNPADSSSPECDLDFSWMDVEMLSPSSSSSSSSPIDDDISWYDQISGDGLDMMSYMIEYGGVNVDYSVIPVEMEEHIYSSLWQETYDVQRFETF